MKFTVLGASGFVGSQLAKHLSAQPENTVFTPQRQVITDNLDQVLTRDLGHVFYCIGLTANFRDHPFETVQAHICILKQILEHGQFESFTYLSSTRVYEGCSTTHESTVLQVSPENREHLYNLTKLTGESLCLASERHTKIVRLSNVFGHAMQPKNFIHQILQEAVKTRTVHFLTNANSAKDYVSVHDVINWLPKIALQGTQTIYNVASGKNTSNQDIALLLQKNDIKISYAQNAKKWSFPQIDINRLEKEFGPAKYRLLDELNELYHYFCSTNLHRTKIIN